MSNKLRCNEMFLLFGPTDFFLSTAHEQCTKPELRPPPRVTTDSDQQTQGQALSCHGWLCPKRSACSECTKQYLVKVINGPTHKLAEQSA